MSGGYNHNYGTSNFLIRHASLRQIQIFESVARNLSFTRAAEELYITQPTVSAQVKSLVEAIDMPLYEQIGRQIHLTEVGEQVASSCRNVINELSNLEIKLDDYRGMKRGRLKIAVISTAKYFAPIALGEFCKKYPETELSLKISNRENIFKRIGRGLDDLYILGQIPAGDTELNVTPFAPNPLVIVAHKDHDLVGKKVSLKRLSKEPFLMREEGSGTRTAIETIFKEKDLIVNERMVLETNEEVMSCVVGGLGVACVSKHGLHLYACVGSLQVLDVEGFPINKEWNIVYPKNREISVLASEFFNFLKDKGKDYIEL